MNNLSQDTLYDANILHLELKEEPPRIPPNGGWKAWRVALGAAILMLVEMVSSYGTFQAYYVDNQFKDLTESEISWIGSIQMFLSYFLGLVCGRIVDAYGTRWIVLAGTISFPLGLIILSFCTEYYQMMLAQGILLGIASATLLHPSMMVVTQWFTTKKALATGVATAGTALGGIIYPIMLSNLFRVIGFAWTMRVTALMALALLIVGSLLVKPFLPPKRKPFFGGLFEGLKDMRLSLLIASSCAMYMGFFVPNFYITVYAEAAGMDQSMSYYCLTLLNVGSLFGRTAITYAADKYGMFNLAVVTSVISTVLTYGLWLTCQKPAGIIAYAILYGIFGTTSFPLISTCCSEISEPEQVGTRMGLIRFCMSFFILAGPPSAGALVGSSGGASDFVLPIIFSGVCWLIASILIICCRLTISNTLFAKV